MAPGIQEDVVWFDISEIGRNISVKISLSDRDSDLPVNETQAVDGL